MINKAKTLKDILWFFIFFGLVAGIFRLWFGLGATTNLTDSVPWGLWKVLNMIAGVALSTCGFTIGFLVYVLKIEKFKPLVKPAILVAFLGYGSSCFALLFDIGQPYRFLHPLFMWNEHSFLFEVFWCVMLYFSVTFIELMPNILEKYKLKKTVGFLHKITIGIVIIGISLSTLHHSSLGSLFLITPYRLSELWYSSLLPVYFFTSAAGCGIMFLIFVKILYSKLYNPVSIFGEHTNGKAPVVCSINRNDGKSATKEYGKDMSMLSSLGIVGASLLAIYLILKIYDLIRLNLFDTLLAGTWESWIYILELLLTTVLPIVLIIIKKSWRSPYGLGIAAFSASLGLALNRLDVGIIGYFRDAGSAYFPSLTEWALSFGVIAAAALVFLFVAENFSIFDEQWKIYKINKGIFKTSFDSISRVWQATLQSGLQRTTIIGVFVIPIAFVLMYPQYKGDKRINVVPASGLNTVRSILIINANTPGMSTQFPHLKHQETLGKEKSCIECHHMSLPNDKSTPCSRCHCKMFEKTIIFNHKIHKSRVAAKRQISGLNPENKTCVICHSPGLPKDINSAVGCMECHNENMNVADTLNLPKQFLYANSYFDVMHKRCIVCHQERKQQVNKPNLDQCSNCHQNYYTNSKAKKELYSFITSD
jgi:Ni/Fe-hydrogenase subunit HybB-like protein